jgi:hypothetical protein
VKNIITTISIPWKLLKLRVNLEHMSIQHKDTHNKELGAQIHQEHIIHKPINLPKKWLKCIRNSFMDKSTQTFVKDTKDVESCELNHWPTPKQTTTTLIQTWERRKGGPHTTRVNILIMWKNEEKNDAFTSQKNKTNILFGTNNICSPPTPFKLSLWWPFNYLWITLPSAYSRPTVM